MSKLQSKDVRSYEVLMAIIREFEEISSELKEIICYTSLLLQIF